MIHFSEDVERDGIVCTYKGKECGFYPNRLFITLQEPVLPFLLWKREVVKAAREKNDQPVKS